jgi:DNA-binding winged helix-turn-helix (wHTH) protein/tetratricopeptide (TPR) repeat protein
VPPHAGSPEGSAKIRLMLRSGGERYEFGEFTLDACERRLSKKDRAVSLEPKAFDVLVALLRHAGRLMTKRELLDLVWPQSFVEEGILAVHVSALRKVLGDNGESQRYIETVARSGYRFVCAVSQQEVSTLGWSLAVLPARPFNTEILSGRDEATCLTLADALIDHLGRFRQIVVRPTRAVQGYVNGGENLAAVGRALRVDAVLATTFLRTADRVRVSARLFRAQDGSDLWGSEFDESASDIIAIAGAVAGSVAAYLGLNAHSNGGKLSRTRSPFPPQVYELFGQGRSHLLRASVFEVPKAIEAFRAAIELAPAYAGAHAGLALAQCAQAEFRIAPPSAAYGEAKASALRALAMDDSCADAQIALGAVLFWSEWNWTGAERSLQRALEINPNHTEAYLLYGRLLEAQGRLEEGLAMKLRALERDPFSPLVHLQISISYFLERRYEDSIEWANKALEIDPQHPHAREHLAGAYWKKGDFDQYMAENVKQAELHGAPASLLEPLKQAYNEGGIAGVRAFFLQRASSQPQAFPAMQLAIWFGEAGELDAAFRHLDRALESHDPGLVHMAVGPQWDSLRADPRFDERVRRMGLAVPVHAL